jgi:Mrp family chromosome partitioning ATPase
MTEADTLFNRLAWRVTERLPVGDGGKVVLVTSARPREGKTRIASGLAAALVAQTGSAVALVDCAPGTASGDPGNPSLCGLLEAATLDARPVKDAGIARVSRFAYGNDDISPLFRVAAVARVTQHLRGRFAFVVLDGPDLPACGVLSHSSDGALLVVNADRTRREIVQGSLRANPFADGKLLGVVLNETPRYVPRWVYRRAL